MGRVPWYPFNGMLEIIKPVYQPGVIFVPQGIFCDFWGHYWLSPFAGMGYQHLVHKGWGAVRIIIQCTGLHPTIKNFVHLKIIVWGLRNPKLKKNKINLSPVYLEIAMFSNRQKETDD